MVSQKAASQEVQAMNSGALTDDQLSSITDFNSAVALLQSDGLIDVTEFGTGFALAEKETLIGTPFVIVESRFSEGTYGPFVSVALVTEDGRKLIINDGSPHGVCGQMQRIATMSGRSNGILVKKGLVRSEYKVKDATGKEIPSTTWYLAGM